MAKPWLSNETQPKKLLSKLQTQFRLGSDDLGLCQCQQEPRLLPHSKIFPLRCDTESYSAFKIHSILTAVLVYLTLKLNTLLPNRQRI